MVTMESVNFATEIGSVDLPSYNTTSGATDDDDLLQTINDKAAYNLIPIFVTCGMIMLLGIIGNSLVVQVYWCRMHHSAKRTFILALALLDLTVCVVVIPFEMYDLRNQSTFQNDSLCKSMRFLEYTTVLSAGFVLVSVSFERYYFLCRAFQDFTPRKAKAVCLTCTVAAMIVATPASLFAGLKTRNFQEGGRNITGFECSMNSERNNNDLFKRIYYYGLAAIFFGCFLVFIIIYSIIGHLLWKYHRGRLVPNIGKLSDKVPSSGLEMSKHISHENSSAHSHGSCSSKKDKSFKIHGRRCVKSTGSIIIFFSVTAVFVLSFLPHIIIRLLTFFDIKLIEDLDEDSSVLLYNFIVRSYLISNVCNPFIYSILNKSFRKELKRTFQYFFVCCKKDDVNLLAIDVRRNRYV